jgi:hypothetical protein
MKFTASRVAFTATTVVENAATALAALLLLWMLSRPFTISRVEARSLQSVFGIIEVSLIAAWCAGLLSIASMVVLAKSSTATSVQVEKKWGWISAAVNILVTVAIFATPRIGAVAGPPGCSP